MRSTNQPAFWSLFFLKVLALSSFHDINTDIHVFQTVGRQCQPSLDALIDCLNHDSLIDWLIDWSIVGLIVIVWLIEH